MGGSLNESSKPIFGYTPTHRLCIVSRVAVITRAFRALKKMRELGISGDLGFGLSLGIVLCLALHVTGATPNEIWGVPYAIAYGGTLAVAMTLLSWGTGWIPDRA